MIASGLRRALRVLNANARATALCGRRTVRAPPSAAR